MSQDKHRNTLGWSGAFLSLTAYGLNTLQVVSSGSPLCLAVNIVACSCLGNYTCHKKAYANTVVNSLWLVFSLLAMIRQLYA